MYLKSLELLGFKSFATKTQLNFHRGVTAVVGPNGCGKSNVLDAIRWVLGEQSAKALRGGEMADVIFSGTDSRQALGMAEVSMTFADCEKELGVDWNEVRITRRVFRDGKGEYLINKAPCRLRDIHELFMDTGIGRSAYSIMEQGKIDQILSSKPEDRRAIFEEAAGITKYKAQKKEALRKLDHTEANLVRVADIIREVKRQIGSLQRQAGKARRYQSLSEALRIFDTHLTHRNFRELAEQLDKITQEIEQIDRARGMHEEEMASQETEHATCRERLGEIDISVGNLRDECQQVRNRIFSAEHRVESHGHRIEEFRELIGRNERDIAAAEEKLQTQQSQISETDARIGELLSVLRAGEEALRAQEAEVLAIRGRRDAAEKEIGKIAEEFSSAEAGILHLTTEKSSALARREAAEARLASLREEADAASAEAAGFSQSLEAARQKAATLQEGLQASETAIAARQEELELAKSESMAAGDELRVAEKRLAELESRLDVLKQLEARGEGLGEGAQALLKGLNDPGLFAPAIRGAVASLVDIEPRFVGALEAILGKRLEAVLFRDADVAQAALQSLAEGEFGRAHLLLGNHEPTEAAAQVPGNGFLPEGALAWAEDCLRGPEDLLRVLRPQLRGVVIVESLAAAVSLRSTHRGFSFVTLSGEVLDANGFASAGAIGGGTGAAILRKREIAEVSGELDIARERAGKAKAELEGLQDRVAALELELASARQHRQELQMEISTARGEAGLLERQLLESQKRREGLGREQEQLSRHLEETGNKVGEYESRLQELFSTRDRLRAGREEADTGLAMLREKEAEETENLAQLRLRVATERQQRENLERQREPMAARMQELAELLRQRGSDIENYRARIDGLGKEISELTEGIEAGKTELTGLEGEVTAMLSQRSEVQESADALETTLRVARQQLSDLQERKGKLEVQTTQIQLRQENYREHISRRYQIDLETFTPDRYALLKALKDQKVAVDSPEAEATAGPSNALEAISAPEDSEAEEFSAPPPEEAPMPWQEIQAVVDELSTRLESMGPVNLDAIQEFEELEQRYQFLEQQNQDLANSKDELMEVISKINKTTREMFAETFEKIRVNFQEMFRELFGGGRANLILSDESDPLESGIDIIAKPPGKQLQSVSLLSGGERTMTAVSLLFAIYMVKPSPFCVLDEMDAPLDESNISRFIKILDRFVDQSQFVVITHNKRTISRADVLYGVTMEEHGISKLVGVQFHKREADNAEKNRSIAGSFGKSEKLASEDSAETQAEPEPEPSTIL